MGVAGAVAGTIRQGVRRSTAQARGRATAFGRWRRRVRSLPKLCTYLRRGQGALLSIWRHTCATACAGGGIDVIVRACARARLAEWDGTGAR